MLWNIHLVYLLVSSKFFQVSFSFYFFLSSSLLFYFGDMVSLYGPGTHSLDQSSLLKIRLPLLTPPGLGIKVCATIFFFEAIFSPGWS